MNTELLNEHVDAYLKRISESNEEVDAIGERAERKKYYSSFNKEKIINMDENQFYEYIEKLWAMIIWGNKQYIINKYIADNGFKNLKEKLAYLLYGKDDLEVRWDSFKKDIKGFGPAMMSELLCYINPNEYMIWNATAKKSYNALGIANVPSQNYQVTGKKYMELTKHAKEIQKVINKKDKQEHDLLFVDYFFWDELKDVPSSASSIKSVKTGSGTEKFVGNKSYHNEIIDDIKEIGNFLGYNTNVKGNVGKSGKIADAVWEFTVGNIGKIKYVFEVQDSGSIDSLIVSLMNASQDISVQAVIAVSDKEQIEKIRQHCRRIEDKFNGKIKYWNIDEVKQAYDDLSTAMQIINNAISVVQD